MSPMAPIRVIPTEEIRNDMDFLLRVWSNVQKKKENSPQG